MPITKRLLPFLLSMIMLNIAHSGAMGNISSSCCTGFFSLEGGYTWSGINGYDLTIQNVTNVSVLNIRSTISRRPFTARLAAGLLSMYDDNFGVTAELGWGYYGRTGLTPVLTILDRNMVPLPVSPPNFYTSQSFTISGFDALLGLAYVQPNYTLSVKGGALIQNLVSTFSSNIATNNHFQLSHNQTGILPAIKLGAGYNFDQNWSLIASYYLAVGGRVRSVSTNEIRPGLDDIFTLDAHHQNPMLNVALLGIQYTV